MEKQESARLLRAHAPEPGGSVDPADIGRRARRRQRMSAGAGIAGVVVLVSLALAGAASFQRGPVVFLERPSAPSLAPPAASVAPSSAADPAAETATSRSAPASATPDQAVPSASEVAAVDPPVRPQRWAGVQKEDGGFVVVFSDGEGGPSLPFEQGAEEALEVYDVTDLVVADTPLVGWCCEPTSGTLLRLTADEPELVDQGWRASLSADGTVFARTDTFGFLGIWPAFPEYEHRVTRTDVAAFDVAVAPDGASVVALTDPELVAQVYPVASERGLLVFDVVGSDVSGERELPLARAYCSLVALSGQRLALLRSDAIGSWPSRCTGTVLDVIDLTTGEVQEEVLVVTEGVRHLEVDAGGAYLLVTDAAGGVRWATVTGEGGVLAGGGFLAADW